MTTDVIIDPNNGKIYWNNGQNDQSISIGGNAADKIFITGYDVYYSPNSNPNPSGTDWVIFNDSASSTLIPGSSGNDLGSANNRWELFATSGNFDSTIFVSDTTNSIGRTTGSFRTMGGIAVSRNAAIGGTLFFTGSGNTTHVIGLRAGVATSTLFTYTLPVSPPSGIGIGLSILSCNSGGAMIWVPNSVLNGNQYEIPVYSASGSGIFITGSSNLRNETNNSRIMLGYSTDSSSLTTGALTVNGGIAITRSVSIGQTLQIFNSSTGYFTGFRSSQAGISTSYTLPASTPSIGTSSILQSDRTGTLSWAKFYPYISKSVTILDPQIDDKVTLFFVDNDIEISKVQTVIRGVPNVSVTWQMYHGLRDSGTAVFNSSQTTNNPSVGNTHDSGFNDNSVDANKFVWVQLSNVSVGTSEFHMTVFYPHN